MRYPRFQDARSAIVVVEKLGRAGLKSETGRKRNDHLIISESPSPRCFTSEINNDLSPHARLFSTFSGAMYFAPIALVALLVTIPTLGLNIVLGNDDGWAEMNIRVLYDTLNSDKHTVVVSAPAENKSGSGR